MKTKLFSLLCTLMCAGNLFAYSFEVDGIYYNKLGGDSVEVTYKTTSDNSYAGSVSIPEVVTYSYTTYRVTTIGMAAFYKCSGLTSVTIPNSIATIGNDAFYGCSGLTSVTIPNSVTTIGDRAFEDCSGLTSVTIGNSVTTIGWGAFEDCSGLTSVTIPNSVTTIGVSAFEGCSGLTSITIPNSVTTIGSFAFSDCSRLTSPVYNSNCFAYMPTSYKGTYNIPDGIKQIAGGAFLDCSGLTSVTIGNSVTTIGNYAFSRCSGLTSVTIPNSVTTIGVSAFEECTRLTSVTIGNSVTTIGNYAFSRCSGLKTVTIGNSVTTIGNYAFAYCSGLTSVTIPNSVTTIGDLAFYNCSGLKTVTIPNSVTTIGNKAFYNCSGLKTVTIPNSVTTIGKNAFYNCTGLTSIDVDAANTHYVSIDGVLFNHAKDTLIQCPAGNSRTEYIIPNSVTTIGGYAFAFCSGLTLVTIPNSVTTIGEYAFGGCSGLTSITCYATNPPTCGYYCFSNVDKTIPVYVPARSVDAYKQANEWKDFTNIQAIKQGQCGTNLYWQYNDGVLVISGTGAMYDYTQGTAPWMPLFKDSISSLVINNGCTSIGNFAFNGLSNKNFKTIDIPNSVEQIGQFAFANCEYIKNVYLGLSLEKISANAFANDERLLYITCYAIEPPLLDESAFVNYDAYLSVPCAAQADYKVAKGWKLFNKENISCIGAEEKPVAGDEVTIAPSADNVTITWPANDNASEYKLVITKDGIVFCTLTFNAQGQLTGIAFAPNRAGSRMLDAAVMTANGWQFTVTGLDQASKYGYALDALNASKQSIKHYEGEFATDGYTSLEWVTSDKIQGINKMLLDGNLYILRDGNLYTATGARVK